MLDIILMGYIISRIVTKVFGIFMIYDYIFLGFFISYSLLSSFGFFIPPDDEFYVNKFDIKFTFVIYGFIRLIEWFAMKFAEELSHFAGIYQVFSLLEWSILFIVFVLCMKNYAISK